MSGSCSSAPGWSGAGRPVRGAELIATCPGRGPPVAERERPTEYVQSVQRALDVIKSFTPKHPSMTLTEVAERTHLTRGRPAGS
ncbi:helix-turn-helix domain-containing protein [Blastococcus brunescens]|uniref:Helix-turn-helix domain-containing protein n=1 Tax=Blastococcus brunescens TaxID=1564165 RepID=A0ABZ1B3D1_9ACTN|nr:helix-turn-helix domain-containing protein [Blastococcus sp. BMG 8361]WRL64231.1 helix-turn-helix domain-containing protein [Blastococcus sp. BMG 8361]